MCVCLCVCLYPATYLAPHLTHLCRRQLIPRKLHGTAGHGRTTSQDMASCTGTGAVQAAHNRPLVYKLGSRLRASMSVKCEAAEASRSNVCMCVHRRAWVCRGPRQVGPSLALTNSKHYICFEETCFLKRQIIDGWRYEARKASTYRPVPCPLQQALGWACPRVCSKGRSPGGGGQDEGPRPHMHMPVCLKMWVSVSGCQARHNTAASFIMFLAFPLEGMVYISATDTASIL